MIKKIPKGYEIDGKSFHAGPVTCDRALTENEVEMVEGVERIYCLQKNTSCSLATFRSRLKSGQRCWLEEVLK